MKRQTTVSKKDDPKQYRKELWELEKQESKRVNLTLKHSEYERLKSEASRSKLSPTKYAYRAVMATIDDRMKRFLPAPSTITILAQTLKPLARNFNQLVRRANTYGATDVHLQQATHQLEQIHNIVERAFNNDATMEQRLVAYLYRDPQALKEVETIIQNFKEEKGIQ